LRLPVDFMLKRSVVRGNLKNIRKWKRQIFWSEELGLYPENILPNVSLGNDKGKLAISYSDRGLLSPEEGNVSPENLAIETASFFK